MREDKKDLKAAWTEHIARYPFEWFVTLTFQNSVSSEEAKKDFIKWLRSLCKKEHLQIAAIVVFNNVRHSHLHLLMFGRNRDGKNLSTVSKEHWERQWSNYRAGCVIVKGHGNSPPPGPRLFPTFPG
jgi:hypothetical protein